MSFRRLRWAGLAVAAVSLAVTAAAPREMGPLPEGMKTPVIALELVRTPGEVERMFGLPGSAEREAWTVGMRTANVLDFGLAAAYGFFLWSIARMFGRAGARGAGIAAGLAILSALCDALENSEILAILAALGNGYERALGWLEVFTWIKWFALGAYFVVLAAPLLRAGLAFRLAAVCGVLAALSSWIAVFVRGVFAEVMALTVAAAILALAVGCLTARGEAAPAPAS
jgi:hypothetical protein